MAVRGRRPTPSVKLAPLGVPAFLRMIVIFTCTVTKGGEKGAWGAVEQPAVEGEMFPEAGMRQPAPFNASPEAGLCQIGWRGRGLVEDEGGHPNIG